MSWRVTQGESHLVAVCDELRLVMCGEDRDDLQANINAALDMIARIEGVDVSPYRRVEF